MTIAASDDATATIATEASDPATALALLCRLARSSFGAAAASLSFADGTESVIDVDPGVAASDFAFATRFGAGLEASAPPLIIEDASSGAAPSGWPDSAGSAGIRFVASLPAGTAARLSIFGLAARRFGAEDQQRLADFAALAAAILALEARVAAAEAGEAEFRQLTEASTDTIVRGSLDGVRLYVSPSIRTLLGYEPEELVGGRAIDITHPDDLPAFAALMRDVRAGRIRQGRSEMRQRHRNGSWVWLEAFLTVIVNPRTGLAEGYVTSVRGIDHRKTIEAELTRRADQDDLTGLPNRKLFREHLQAAFAALEDGGPPFAVLWMDVDHFKAINDSHGHAAGDAVLVEAALRFRSAAGAGDLVARLGGDEFAVLHRLGSREIPAEELAAQLLAAMALPFLAEGRRIAVGLSIGIARAPEAGTDADAMLAAADASLYRAKSAGRGTVR